MPQFQNTSWSLIFLAGTETPEARDALQKLCSTYLPPVVAFIRSKGYREDEARDLAQEFFAKLLEKDWLHDADRTRGKFRTFLLTSLTHFLSNQRAFASAQKRGGGIPNMSLDDAVEVMDASMRPELLYDRKWALTILECALDRLKREQALNGGLDRFEALKGCLTPAEPSASYREIAARLNTTEGAAKVACHRLKKAYGAAIRAEIENTLPEGANPDDELKYLMRALSNPTK